MSAESELRLRYKGERTYLHGTDIYAAVSELLAPHGISEASKIDLVFHQVVKSQLCAVVHRDGTINEPHANVVFRCNVNGENVGVSLKETGEPVTERYPYDEDVVSGAAVIDKDEKRISCTSLEGYSNIEMFVALNKHLLSRLFPEVRGKWFFTRLQLNRSIHELPIQEFEIRFNGHSNFRITRSTIFGDGSPLGSIYFSLVPAE